MRPRPRGTWFRRVSAEFCPLAMRFAGLPIRYVEVGCWSGNSAAWVASNVLTHPESVGHGIDPYLPDYKHGVEEVAATKEIAIGKIRATKVAWLWHFFDSKQVFREWGYGPIDLLYLDGSHDAWDVVQDFALAWPLLKVGSVVIFDDLAPMINRRRKTPHVKEAFQAIKIAWATKIKVLGEGPKQASLEVLVK